MFGHDHDWSEPMNAELVDGYVYLYQYCNAVEILAEYTDSRMDETYVSEGETCDDMKVHNFTVEGEPESMSEIEQSFDPEYDEPGDTIDVEGATLTYQGHDYL